MQIIQDAANTNLMFLIQIIVISATYKKNNKNKFQTHRLQCSLYRFWYASLFPGFIPSKTAIAARRDLTIFRCGSISSSHCVSHSLTH